MWPVRVGLVLRWFCVAHPTFRVERNDKGHHTTSVLHFIYCIGSTAILLVVLLYFRIENASTRVAARWARTSYHTLGRTARRLAKTRATSAACSCF